MLKEVCVGAFIGLTVDTAFGILKLRIMQTKVATIKAKYINGMFQPLDKVDFLDGEEVTIRFEVSNPHSDEAKRKQLLSAVGGWKDLFDSEPIQEKRWLKMAAQDTADRLAALEAELPEDEVASWHRAMKQAAKPARYVPGKGVVIQ